MAHGMRTDAGGGYGDGYGRGGHGRGGGYGGGPGGGGRRAALERYALVPLRVFLGVTFIYAGLDKLTDSAFFHASGAGSIGEQMRGVRDVAAIPALVDLALKSPAGFGYAIAFGELAVGVGTLLGVWGRVAALGGAVISLSLWLTVSWAATPYYLGNDLAYLMAWVPLVVGGAGVWSVDVWLARRRGRG
ncbi:DoxX family protein [Streptomyces sp. NPDC049813]|uniref:DoxX family protein n=1 Tax=Streptomyces sp. NPDC049813 TaxID=3365597 RepID=UPI0037ABCC71